jgi:hypothetical protein
VAIHPLETYLEELRLTRSSGTAVPETSYYPALSNHLNEAGRALKPRVHCIMHLKTPALASPMAARSNRLADP